MRNKKKKMIKNVLTTLYDFDQRKQKNIKIKKKQFFDLLKNIHKK